MEWDNHNMVRNAEPEEKEDFKRELEKMNKHKWTVTRDSKDCEVVGEDLVVGDIITLKGAGNIIPADGLWVSASSILLVDESKLTGEPEHVEKGEAQRFFYSGTEIRGGECKMIVLCVGDGSQHGKMFCNPNRHAFNLSKKH